MSCLENFINGVVNPCKDYEDRQRVYRSLLDFRYSKSVGYNLVAIFYGQLISHDTEYTRCFHLHFYPSNILSLRAF